MAAKPKDKVFLDIFTPINPLFEQKIGPSPENVKGG